MPFSGEVDSSMNGSRKRTVSIACDADTDGGADDVDSGAAGGSDTEGVCRTDPSNSCFRAVLFSISEHFPSSVVASFDTMRPMVLSFRGGRDTADDA